jgi:homoserine kinase
MSTRLRVPATSANLGPGFDVFGMSLSLYNILEFEERPQGSVRIEVSGEGVDDVPRVKEYNLAYRGFSRYFESRGRKAPGVRLHQYNEVPVTRGLGSSATAIVSGLFAAMLLDGREIDREELLRLAVEVEGHPDNVAPAVYGGFVVSGVYGHEPDKRVHTVRLLVPPDLSCIVAIPSFMLSTGLARRVLPGQVSMPEAVSNVRNAALLVASLATGSLDKWEQVLPDVIGDRLHQPYRLPLIKGGEQAMEAARGAGAIAAAISGSGPSILAFSKGQGQALQIGNAMRQAFAKAGVSVRIMQLRPETQGVHLLS